jgi:hypothetical protein
MKVGGGVGYKKSISELENEAKSKLKKEIEQFA